MEATQIAQGMIFQFALEHYRRRKPRTSCVALCHFMTHMPDIKWGIIDYYGDRKLSFDYVKRAYQPVLASVYYERRRWNPGEQFKAELHVVNDLHTAFNDAKLEWEIRTKGSAVANGATTVNIAENCSESVLPIEWTVAGDALEMFEVAAKLTASNGELLSDNYHALLIDDHETAKSALKKRHRENGERMNSRGKTYYRYFPEQMQLD